MGNKKTSEGAVTPHPIRRGLALFLLALLFSACASPRAWKNSRRGFFASLSETTVSKKGGPHSTQGAHWVWPLDSLQVTSPFGIRQGSDHDGVDLRAKKGTPIYAVADGKVIYAAHKISGYGKMIVIKHPSGHSSVYAHASKLNVVNGNSVKRGQKIAESGATGRAEGPHLHFEVREGSKPIDPMRLLARASSPARERLLASNQNRKKDEAKTR